ncbi:hypothetical protein GWI33_008018 [Rhynchophorus ferrugineus]|uniref:Uncharacterized protein n=1 Tax=Rhynchophorus ferrugineus TaxID=354439 RepID=A0A834MF08_RHYFE|nr:hypothetical protein GWI33_008018 [Rhynchophorus ferrugineus]
MSSAVLTSITFTAKRAIIVRFPGRISCAPKRNQGAARKIMMEAKSFFRGTFYSELCRIPFFLDPFLEMSKIFMGFPTNYILGLMAIGSLSNEKPHKY